MQATHLLLLNIQKEIDWSKLHQKDIYSKRITR